ncbi:MAG: DUF3244 domain-containing protein [Saprospiraceae bacterium]|nr:DUF3244 domain-containing protein [Saprospiraceae bacterium]
MQQKFLLVFFFMITMGFTATAQSLASNKSGEAIQSSKLKEIQADNWDIFADDENKIYYVDFESLNITLSDIVVKNASGSVILKDDVFDLPVDTIYEIDLSDQKKGTYKIELRSFTSVIRKSIQVK